MPQEGDTPQKPKGTLKGKWSLRRRVPFPHSTTSGNCQSQGPCATPCSFKDVTPSFRFANLSCRSVNTELASLLDNLVVQPRSVGQDAFQEGADFLGLVPPRALLAARRGGNRRIGADVDGRLAPDDVRAGDVYAARRVLADDNLHHAICEGRLFRARVVFRVGKQDAPGRPFFFSHLLEDGVTDAGGSNEGLRADEVIDRLVPGILRRVSDGRYCDVVMFSEVFAAVRAGSAPQWFYGCPFFRPCTL